ncbi:MAG: hypothetical protein ABJP34_07280 [Erythrobacter sp.]
MAHILKVIGTSACLTAAASMAAVPASAAELPASATPTNYAIAGGFDAEEGNAEGYRYRRYRRNRVRTSDVIGGILVLGTIAAVASASSNSKRRDRDYRRTSNYPQRRGDTRASGAQGLQGAVNSCVSSIERDVRVENVDNVSRTAAGWQVTGTIFNGDRFDCRIGQNGSIESVNYGGNFSASATSFQRPVQDRQHNSDRYAAAWDRVERGETASQSQPQYREAATTYSEQRAAYPGGPVAGEALDNRPEAPTATRVAQAANTRR